MIVSLSERGEKIASQKDFWLDLFGRNVSTALLKRQSFLFFCFSYFEVNPVIQQIDRASKSQQASNVRFQRRVFKVVGLFLFDLD